MKMVTDQFTVKRYLEHPIVTELIPASVLKSAHLCRYEAGETIINQGRRSQYLYILAYGKCMLSAIVPNGKRSIIRMVGPRSMVGEVELVKDEPSPITVTCLEESMFILLEMNISRSVLLNDNHFMRWLCNMIMEKGQNSTYRLAQRNTYRLKNQFAKFILDYSEGDLFKVKKTMMAESIGVSYRHTCHMMNELIASGCITKDHLTYRITDRKQLQMLAQGMDY